MSATIRVPLAEVARQYALGQLSGHHPRFVIFALQRLMQGRCIEVDLPSGETVKLKVVQWVFAWDDRGSLMPGRFSLFQGDGPALPVCEGCWGDAPKLWAHPLFESEQLFFRSLLSCEYSADDFPILRPLNSCVRTQLPIPDSASGVPEEKRWYWKSSLRQRRIACDKEHTFHLLALLVECSDSPLPMKWPEAVAPLIHSAVSECFRLLVGAAEPEATPAPVWIARSVRNVLGTSGASTLGDSIDVGDATSKIESQEVDRLIELCARLSSQRFGEFDPLLVLVIRRCGEPEDESDAHARFAFGSRHWQRIRDQATSNYADICRRIVEGALRLADLRVAWKRIAFALSELGFGPSATASLQELRAVSEGDRGGLPDASALLESVERAFRKSFVVRSVVSNRVMGSCLAEWVGGLWQSPGLLRTLGEYPLDLLFCEIPFFPEETGTSLFYVPLVLPASRRHKSSSGFFSSYAVVMCRPLRVPEEDFREAAESLNGDIHLAFLEDAYLGMRDAARHGANCEEHLALQPSKAREELDKVVRIVNRCLLDLLRLAGFSVRRTSVLVPALIPAGWHAGDGVGQHARPVASARLVQPADPGLPVAGKLQQELLAVTPMGDVPHVAGQMIPMGAWHGPPCACRAVLSPEMGRLSVESVPF